MARRITLVALIGLITASLWVVLSLFLHIGPYKTIIEITAPAALLGRSLAMKYYWFIWLNAVIYAAVALLIELCRLLFRRVSH